MAPLQPASWFNKAKKAPVAKAAPSSPKRLSSTRASQPPPLILQSSIEKPVPVRQRSNSDNSRASGKDASPLGKYESAPTGGASMPPPSAFELQIIKQKDATLGLSLGQLAGGEPGVIVTKLTPTVANAPVKGKTLFKGSIIYSIATPQTGGEFVPAIRFRDVAALLRDAEGTITLKVGRAAVPEGWSERVDDNHETYYVHTEKHLMTSDHPAASFEQA
uniref:PDZ domain-containing protein n=1 Tax=Prymnesium polylepis TaxID=72548 RepID=A0A7S4MNY0_9EUKA